MGIAEEYLRLGKKKASMQITVITGKDGDYYVSYCPSLETTGAGNTREESLWSLKVCIEILIEELYEMSTKDRDDLLYSYGWRIEANC